MTNFFKNILPINWLLLISIFFLAFTLPSAVGYDFALRRVVVFFLFLFIARFNAFSVIFMFIYSLLAGLYLPAGFTYGSLSSGVMFSISETNTNELFDNLANYPLNLYVLALLTIISSFYYLSSYFTKKKVIKSSYKTYAILLIWLSLLPVSYLGRSIKNITIEYLNYTDALQQITSSLNKSPSWVISNIHKQDRTFVVVIGESVRRDYLSVYGYSYNTTPFLNKANGIFIDGAISTAPNTTPSLIRTLTRMTDDGYIDLSNNIVTLAKSAGYKTYWLSNQGFWGTFDQVATKIAMFSDHHYFLKAKESSEYQDDFLLLAELNNIIEQDTGPKVIFVHMDGSHINPCSRLFDYPNNYNLGYGESLDCYLATIHKLDSFIEKINTQLLDVKTDYSLIYFSDHGQKIENNQNNAMISHSGEIRQGYEVPFFILDSQVQERIYLKKNFTFFNFLNFFANKIGVESPQLLSKYSLDTFPEEKNIRVYNNKTMVDFDTLADNPTIE